MSDVTYKLLDTATGLYFRGNAGTRTPEKRWSRRGRVYSDRAALLAGLRILAEEIYSESEPDYRTDSDGAREHRAAWRRMTPRQKLAVLPETWQIITFEQSGVLSPVDLTQN